jgi:hypothetical protein
MSEPLRLWSVTTLIKLGLGTSDPLVNWVAKTTAEAAIDQRRVIDEMLRADDRQGAIEHLTKARYRKSGKAAVRGSDLHAVADQLALGAEPEVPKHVAPYAARYRDWLERFQPRFLMSEAPVYNVSQHYAGTLDGIIELAGRSLLFDLKTTEHPPDGARTRPPYPEVALQLVAYSRAELVGVLSEQRYSGGRRYYLFDPELEHEPLPRLDGALTIVVSPFDCLAVPVRVDDTVWRAFLHVRECARWQVETSRGLFGPPLAAPAKTKEVA